MSGGAGRFAVRYEDAFPSYFTGEEEARIREVLSNPSRGPFGRRGTGRSYPFAILRYARCAHLQPDGERCSRLIRPAKPRDNQYGHATYRAITCGRWLEPAHTTTADAEVGEYVLEILQDIFTPARLGRALARIRVEEDELTSQLGAKRAEIDRLRGMIASANRLVLQADAQAEELKDSDPAKAQAWREIKENREADAVSLTIAVQKEEVELENLEEQEDEFLDSQEGDLQRIVEMAKHLPELIREARTVPFALQRIVRALTRRVWIRSVGARVVELFIEFPSGAEISRLVAFSGAPGTPAERVYALGRMSEGAQAEEVAAELSIYAETTAPGWTAHRVVGAMLVAKHFQSVRLREGDYQPLSEIAEVMEEPPSDVLHATLKGELGPVEWADGELRACPSRRELHGSFPRFAAKELGDQLGLASKDMIREYVVRRVNSLPQQGTAAGLSRIRSFQDAAHQRWLLVDEVLAAGLRIDPPGEWIEEDRAALAEAVGGAYPDLDPEDFVRAVDLGAELKARFPSLGYGLILVATRTGRIPAVRSRHRLASSALRTMLFVHAPQEVREASEIAVVEAWLGRKVGRRTRPRRPRKARRVRPPKD